MVAAPQVQKDSMDYVLEGIDQERTGRVQAVYSLWEIYRHLPDAPGMPGQPGPRTRLLNEVGGQRNIDPTKLAKWMTVAERMPWAMLMGAFPETADGEPSWHLGLTWTHLEKVALAGGETKDKFGPEQRIKWLIESYNAGMSTADLDNYLRTEGAIQPRTTKAFTPQQEAKERERIELGYQAAAHLQKCLAGDYGPDVKVKVARSWGKREAALPQMPSTLCGLLRVMLDQLEAEGQDKPLTTKAGTFKASALLAKAAGMLMGATFTLGTTEEANLDGDGDRP